MTGRAAQARVTPPAAAELVQAVVPAREAGAGERIGHDDGRARA
jgi:hypothetical protein